MSKKKSKEVKLSKKENKKKSKEVKLSKRENKLEKKRLKKQGKGNKKILKKQAKLEKEMLKKQSKLEKKTVKKQEKLEKKTLKKQEKLEKKTLKKKEKLEEKTLKKQAKLDKKKLGKEAKLEKKKLKDLRKILNEIVVEKKKGMIASQSTTSLYDELYVVEKKKTKIKIYRKVTKNKACNLLNKLFCGCFPLNPDPDDSNVNEVPDLPSVKFLPDPEERASMLKRLREEEHQKALRIIKEMNEMPRFALWPEWHLRSWVTSTNGYPEGEKPTTYPRTYLDPDYLSMPRELTDAHKGLIDDLNPIPDIIPCNVNSNNIRALKRPFSWWENYFKKNRISPYVVSQVSDETQE